MVDDNISDHADEESLVISDREKGRRNKRIAVKRIVNCGYSEEIAKTFILKSGLYHGSKDVVSNIVDGALALLSRKKVLNIGRPVVFADLPSLVDYTLMEMVCVMREVKPALPVVEAM
uniref:PIR2-like helical domain-containing protein n=1 Tax=Solanum lycopersicum TaxID=4081 RepID=A0A3Q7I6X0_SOLLC